MKTDEVVAWITFRRPLPLNRWPELTDGLLKRSLRDWGLSDAFKSPDEPGMLLAAMETQAAGHNWRGSPPSPPPRRRLAPEDMSHFWPFFPYPPASVFRMHVRRLVRRIGVPVLDLLRELRHDVALLTEFDQKFEAAHTALMEAVREGRITAWGRPALGLRESNVSAVHEALPMGLLLGPRTIDFTGWLLYDDSDPVNDWREYRGPYYDMIRFPGAEVMHLWPPSTAAASLSAKGRPDKAPQAGCVSIDAAGSPQSYRSGRRGRRPEKKDAARVRMLADLESRKFDEEKIRQMKQEALATEYGISRETARKARDEALLQFAGKQISDN